MPEALLLGGPPELRGPRLIDDSDRVGERLRFWTVEPTERRLPFTHGYSGTPGEAVYYDPHPTLEGVFVFEGYWPTEDDEDRVREWLAG